MSKPLWPQVVDVAVELAEVHLLRLQALFLEVLRAARGSPGRCCTVEGLVVLSCASPLKVRSQPFSKIHWCSLRLPVRAGGEDAPRESAKVSGSNSKTVMLAKRSWSGSKNW